MKPHKFAFSNKEWVDRDEKTATFSSPSTDTDQSMIFDYEVKNGSMSASITAIEGQWNNDWGYEFQECAFMFRRVDADHFYAAGVGGFARKFYIAKCFDAHSPWQLLNAEGSAHDLGKGKTSNLRVLFQGNRITLFSEDAEMINATDDSYSSGRCGLRTNRTKGRFANVDITPDKPRCFVIMPFDHGMKSIYEIIVETAKQHNVECDRADKHYISQPIVEEVKNLIDSADLVIIDVTGQNANVYFEACIASALLKKWIILSQSKDDIAFDIKHFRVILYQDKMGYEQQFRDDLSRAIEETLAVSSQSTLS
jgi:hypothetical protein